MLITFAPRLTGSHVLTPRQYNCTTAKILPAFTPTPRNTTKAETSEAAAVGLDEWTKYCEDTSASKRRPTRTVWAGKVPIGSEHRIARQTMTTTNTNDVDATVAQARLHVVNI